jgi:hypothetical protein
LRPSVSAASRVVSSACMGDSCITSANQWNAANETCETGGGKREPAQQLLFVLRCLQQLHFCAKQHRPCGTEDHQPDQRTPYVEWSVFGLSISSV